MNNLWSSKPRNVLVLVDNESWIIPYAKKLVKLINKEGDKAKFIINCKNITENSICFILGCINIIPNLYLQKAFKALVVHESALPLGKGFSPLSWQILEGKNDISICLFEANEKVDSGNIFLKDSIHFDGHELIDELREKQGTKTIDLCMKFLRSKILPKSFPQLGNQTFYNLRKPKDSELDIKKSIEYQFNLLRIVDNDKYPAFFYYKGFKYKLNIKKWKRDE